MLGWVSMYKSESGKECVNERKKMNERKEGKGENVNQRMSK